MLTCVRNAWALGVNERQASCGMKRSWGASREAGIDVEKGYLFEIWGTQFRRPELGHSGSQIKWSLRPAPVYPPNSLKFSPGTQGYTKIPPVSSVQETILKSS